MSRRDELIESVVRLCSRVFHSDYKAMFDAYLERGQSADKGNTLDRRRLWTLLYDAGVGNGVTRSAWVDGILVELDMNGDKALSWDEFQAAILRG